MGLAPAGAFTQRELALPAVPAPLFGTLVLPELRARVPGVLILPGSGPTDRDGNQPGLRNDSLKLLAQDLAACGIASLRIDKRGIAASHAAAPFEEDIHFDDYIHDTVAWLGTLGAQPEISRIDLLGHSEGGIFALLAAERVPVGRLVLLASVGRPVGQLLQSQLDAQRLPPKLQAKAHDIIASLTRGEAVDEVPAPLANLFRASVQEYLIDLFRIDPKVELARTAMPALVVQGTTDVQVSVADAERLAGARAGVQLALIDGMNHVLRTAPPTWAENLRTYGEPTLPLAPALMPLICGFLGGR